MPAHALTGIVVLRSDEGMNALQTAPQFVLRAGRHFARKILDLLLPPRCLGCGKQVEETGTLCGECWRGVGFIAPPLCERCGRPFEFAAAEGSICASCSREPPEWDRARAVFRYDEKSRHLVLRFKHADRTDAAAAFGSWLARSGSELLTDADLIVPVPLHWRRLFLRRYNQATLLAAVVSKMSGIAVEPLALVRRRATPSQGHLNRAERRRNVRGAFAVPAGKREKIAGKRIVLIDDVLTTGSTAAACTQALREAGAARVDVLALARVAAPQAD